MKRSTPLLSWMRAFPKHIGAKFYVHAGTHPLDSVCIDTPSAMERYGPSCIESLLLVPGRILGIEQVLSSCLLRELKSKE